MVILLDSGFLFALKIENDRNHSIAKKILKNLDLKKYGSICTNNMVISELITLTNIRTRHDLRALSAIKSLIWGEQNFFTIIEIPINSYQEIFEIMEKYSDTTKDIILSAVDASLILNSKNKKVDAIISFDHHFDGIINRIYE